MIGKGNKIILLILLSCEIFFYACKYFFFLKRKKRLIKPLFMVKCVGFYYIFIPPSI